jgi:hypothetical protein
MSWEGGKTWQLKDGNVRGVGINQTPGQAKGHSRGNALGNPRQVMGNQNHILGSK